MFLVDTNVISIAAARRHRDDVLPLLEWLECNGSKLYLSVITVAEIEFGVLKLAREGKNERAGAIRVFLKNTLNFYGSRVLPVDVQVALHVAGLRDQSYRQPVELADVIIAATAARHNLTVLTRNVKDFERLDVEVHNPFEALPGY